MQRKQQRVVCVCVCECVDVRCRAVLHGTRNSVTHCIRARCEWTISGTVITAGYNNKKHLKNVGPIRHCQPPHAALPFTRCRYCRVARRLRIDIYNDDDDNDNA